MTVYFLSDFGTADVFAGVVRAVLVRRAPGVRVVDLAHDLPPGDLRHAALQLYAAVPHLAEGGVVLAVVDPGVGSDRRALAVRGERLWYVLPDNGLLTLAAELDPPRAAWALEPRRFAPGPVSPTFHGRDLFAPAAAHLALGQPPDALGPRLDVGELVRLPLATAAGREGEVIAFDRFGNAISNLRPSQRPEAVHLAGRRIPFRTTFADVPEGEAVAYLGSSGLVEIAIRGGSLREKFKLFEGAAVSLHGPEEEPPPLELD
ncbi:SAM hydrolase/SAM-dependent halogenase family protein [Oceanithermus profundus]